MPFLALLLAFEKTCSGALDLWGNQYHSRARRHQRHGRNVSSGSTAWQPEVIANVAGSWTDSSADALTGLDLGDFVFDYNPLLESDKGRLKSLMQSDASTTTSSNRSSSSSNSAAQGAVFFSRLRQRIDERTSLASRLFHRRKQTLRNTACTIGAVCANRLHTVEDTFLSPVVSGGLPSSVARVVQQCVTRVREHQAIMSGGAASSGEDSSRTTTANAKFPEDEPMVEMADSLLSPAERRRVVDETVQLTAAVQEALANDDIWQLLTEKEGVKVWRTHENIKAMARKNARTDAPDGKMGSDGATIRSEAILNAAPHEVYKLFMDNSRVHEYNENCVDLYDIEYLDKQTKLNWCSTGRFGMFKPRDFVTVVHFDKLGDDGFVSVAANMEHEQLAPLPTHVRSQIQLAATFMQAIPGEPNKTRFVQMTQVGQLGGVADNPVAQRMAAKMAESAPIDFITKFSRALDGPPLPQPSKRSSVVQVQNLPFYKPRRQDSVDV